jgi:hypothetical protein
MISGGTTTPSVDVVDDVLALGAALRSATVLRHARIRVRTVAPTWVQYGAEVSDVARFVVVRAELVDHVPTVLKVRALRAAGARPVVVSDDPYDAHRARLREARAEAVLTRENDLDDLLGVLQEEATPPEVEARVELPPTHLSDRQLQLACLYCSHGAPSAKHLARWLGLPVSSVRTNLQRARHALGASDRRELRQRLIDGGWMDGQSERRAGNLIAVSPPAAELFSAVHPG